MKSGRRAILVGLLVLAVAGCTGRPTTASRTTTEPSPSETPAATTPARPNPVSLRALMGKEFDGHGFTVGRVLAREGSYTRYFVTYSSGRLRISGIMNVPAGRGPFPVLVLAHGHFDEGVYKNGQGLRREQDYLARRGYVVVHVDYRNHASSDADPINDLNLRLGYTEDVINAVLALRASSLPSLDMSRVGLVGRSMGGGIALNVAVVKPDLFDAMVLFSPVSSNVVDNFNKWTRGNPQRRELAQRIIDLHGSPEENAAFWRNVSPVSFFDRVQAPILMHHGTSDERCPMAWAQTTVAALRAQRKQVEFFTYPDRHEFGPAWPASMSRTVSFLDARLKA